MVHKVYLFFGKKIMKTKRLKITALILAAGKGTRMGSGHKPKVLHELAGKTLLEHVLDTLSELSLQHHCLVLGENWSDYTPIIESYRDLKVCVQKKQNGTAGAVASCASLFEGVAPIAYADGKLVKGEKLGKEDSVLVCYGDTPLLSVSVLESFIKNHEEAGRNLSVLGMDHPNPKGYGRLILEEDGTLGAIVEEKDSDEEQKKISLCNSGIVMAKTSFLFDLLGLVSNKNTQSEYYLTDIVSLARSQGASVGVSVTKDWKKLTGVNTQDQLKEAEVLYASGLD